MFNFKASSGVAGKVFKKLNHMDKKQAYTYGAIGVVCLVALLTLASVAGGGADDSLDNLNARGYDLAQMPFLNDEAENYLLASKYPDMKNNNISALYSPADKKERQEEDAKEAAESAASAGAAADSSGSYNSSSYGSGYTGRRRGGGQGTPTQIGSFSASGSMASASGGNTSTTYGGTMRGDFSPFQRDSKGNEAPFKPQNAKQALTRFNAASRAAARGANKAVDSRKALLGSNVEGGFGTDSNGVPLGESKGINYDEAESADLSGLDDTMAEKAQESRDKKEAEKLAEGQGFWSMLGGKLLDMGLNLAQQWASNQINSLTANAQAGRSAKAETISELGKDATNKNLSDADFQSKWGAIDRKGASEYTAWYSNKRGYRKNNGSMTRKEAREKFSGWSNQIESSSVYLGHKNAHRGDSSGNIVGNAVGNTPFPSSNNNATVNCPSSQKYDSKKGKCV